MELDAAEIQLLASLGEAMVAKRAADRVSLERHGKWFWVFLEDWPVTFASLTAKGLVEDDERDVRLTESAALFAKA